MLGMLVISGYMLDYVRILSHDIIVIKKVLINWNSKHVTLRTLSTQHTV